MPLFGSWMGRKTGFAETTNRYLHGEKCTETSKFTYIHIYIEKSTSKECVFPNNNNNICYFEFRWYNNNYNNRLKIPIFAWNTSNMHTLNTTPLDIRTRENFSPKQQFIVKWYLSELVSRDSKDVVLSLSA